MGDWFIIKRESRLEVVDSGLNSITSVSNATKLDCVHGKVPIKSIGGVVKGSFQLNVSI